MNEVTVILTSCGRFDLLRLTIESFVKFNTYDVKEFIVHDDSGQLFPDDLERDFPFIRWHKAIIPNLKNQILSLDNLWSLVTTPYAFTLEDDWEFTREGFIEASMEVLETDPKILMAWLIHPEQGNQHPVEWSKNYGILKAQPNLWSGTRFNPALKRKADYDLIAPFSKHTVWNPSKPWKSEADISKVYHGLGFKGAVLPLTYMHHIGEGRHISP